MIHLVPQSEHDSALQNMGDRLESKMNSAFQEFETMINNMMQKTEKRIDKFDEQLKKVEADTYWKIKDYGKLLEARPTLHYVK